MASQELYERSNRETSSGRSGLTLHVFELEGEWNRGLTVERRRGVGQKVVAYSDAPFEPEAQAHLDGRRAYDAARAAHRRA